ncbi:PREDICTED: aspartic proteinase Asp1 [Theobroma cacao]|uniref:Aspartic proteinase Asp1 n=1 Tax=Theobroma cacao TaxID=3641 RepID=A0AB32WSM8_THECC|nr:PREDICTED: aspartic proteinase Asp1 [Theobroma cacao]
MADQEMKGKRSPLMIMVFVFQVLSSHLHGCFAATGQGQPQWQRSTVRPTAVNGFGFGSSVVLPVAGNVYPLGFYSVELKIGNPPKTFQLDIDTGSDLTWVQCDAPDTVCTGCTLPHDRRYKPAKSNFLPCKDPICAALNSPKSNPCKNPNEKCGFKVKYADQVSVLGFMVSDNFHGLGSGSLSNPHLAFGCGSQLENHSPDRPHPLTTAGVLGLGKSKASMSSQLSGMGITKNVVGHCFSGQGGGFLFLGAGFPESKMTWTPMLQNSVDEHYYSSGPAELLFGGEPTGAKGLYVIFDTGATYTYLSSEVYQTLLNLIRKDLAGKQLRDVKDYALPICWKGAEPFKSVRDVRNYFNTLVLSFTGANNNKLVLPPEAYIIVTERGNVCLGILNGTEVGLGITNVIGAISLQDKLVIYDNENQRIGWASADCTRKPR